MTSARNDVIPKPPPPPLALSPPRRTRRPRELRPIRRMPELYQIVIECRDEAQQRELFERLKTEGVKVRLHVL